LLTSESELRTPLLLRNQNGPAPAGTVRIEVSLPPNAMLAGSAVDATLHAWVLGKILNWTIEHGTVSLSVKPMAVLRDYAHQN